MFYDSNLKVIENYNDKTYDTKYNNDLFFLITKTTVQIFE